jgi:hypothetical protein
LRQNREPSFNTTGGHAALACLLHRLGEKDCFTLAVRNMGHCESFFVIIGTDLYRKTIMRVNRLQMLPITAVASGSFRNLSCKIESGLPLVANLVKPSLRFEEYEVTLGEKRP